MEQKSFEVFPFEPTVDDVVMTVIRERQFLFGGGGRGGGGWCFFFGS